MKVDLPPNMAGLVGIYRQGTGCRLVGKNN